jgi:uncharacterized membrane protein
MIPVLALPSWQFWLMWFIAFVGFPIGGTLAKLLVGPVSNPIAAALAGAITGAVLGVAQWLVLRQQSSVSILWILATSLGMALGLAISVTFLGSEVEQNLLWRALVTGLLVGIAQALIIRFELSMTSFQAIVWVLTIGVGFVMGWFITRSVGVDLSPKWSVFGSTGAWAFQVFTGAIMYLLLRSSSINQGVNNVK